MHEAANRYDKRRNDKLRRGYEHTRGERTSYFGGSEKVFGSGTKPKHASPWQLVRRAFLLALLVLGIGSVHAQTAPLEDFLNAVRASPELAASRTALEAAELRLRAAYDPVSLEATGGYSRIDLDESSPLVRLPGGDRTGLISRSQAQLSATLTFRPLPFGDTADLVRQRELEVASSILDYRAALTGLERRALEAALSARLASRSVLLSQEGVRAAEAALEATRTRFERGATNARALRAAEANLLQARTLLQSAEADAQLARSNLTSLVGDTPPTWLRGADHAAAARRRHAAKCAARAAPHRPSRTRRAEREPGGLPGGAGELYTQPLRPEFAGRLYRIAHVAAERKFLLPRTRSYFFK